MSQRFVIRRAGISIDEHEKLSRAFKPFYESFKARRKLKFKRTFDSRAIFEVSFKKDPNEYLAAFLSKKFPVKIRASDIDFVNLEGQPQEIGTGIYMTYKLIKNTVIDEILEEYVCK